MPLKSKDFVLNKSDFTDAINIRYNRDLKGLPENCVCGNKFSITHALNCKRGGFVHMRHDNLRDLNAKLLSKIQKDVEIEPAFI